jgi:membrane dipeptidase
MSDQHLSLISPTFEESPTYLATYDSTERAKQICKDALLMDTLFSAVYPLQWRDGEQFEPVMDNMAAAGFDVLGICTGADADTADPQALLNAARFYATKVYARPEKYRFVRTAQDIREAKQAGQLAIYFTHQGTNVLQGNVDNVALLKALGYGYCLLVYNVRNAVGGGCAEESDPGLSDYGRKVIHAYNKYGMVVDVSHTGNRTALDACDVSTRPMIASHSGAKGVFAAFRNLTDDLVTAIAQTGGVCSMFGTGAYLDPSNPPVVNPDIIFRHIDYMCGTCQGG